MLGCDWWGLKSRRGPRGGAYGVGGGEAAMPKINQPIMAAVRRFWVVQRGMRMRFRQGERRGGDIGELVGWVRDG